MLDLVPLLVIAAATGVVGLVKAHRRSEKAARLAAWQAAADSCGLTDVAVRGFAELTGREGPLTVRMLSFVITGERRGTKLSVDGVPAWLTIGLYNPNQAVDPVRTGDAVFDGALVVDGPELDVRAALDAPSRVRHVELFVPQLAGRPLFSYPGVAPEVAVKHGRCGTRLPDEPVEARGDRVRVALELLLAVARSWTSPVAREERVAANALHDPLPDVRLQNLKTLLRDAADHPVVPSVLEGAVTDADSEIRLTAAIASGPRGQDVLRALITDASIPDDTAARAIDAFGQDADPAEVTDWLARAQTARRVASIAAGLRQLARPDRPVPAALVDALIYDAPTVRETAALLLGRIGASADHVVELNRVAAMHARDEPFVRAARTAVAAIQSRLVGADRGQLSVALAAGELSLVQDPDGRVSIARDGGDA